MSAHSCDVCQQDAHLACSHCLQAVYCGETCQAADFTEHRDICTHVDELAHDEVLDEVAGHLEDADSDADEAVMQAGYEIIEAQDSDAGRAWIGEVLRSELVGAWFKPRGQKKGGLKNWVKRGFAKRKAKAGDKAYRKTMVGN